MTTKCGSGTLLAVATRADAHTPVAKAIMAAVASATPPPASVISQPQSKAASDPQLPGTQGRCPIPNAVATNAAGCHHAKPAGVGRLISSASLRKPGPACQPFVPPESGSRLSPGLRFMGRQKFSLQRQAHRRDRLRRDALAAPGKAEPLGRGCLDADPAG